MSPVSDTKQAVQPQKMDRCLEFQIKEVDGQYYIYVVKTKALISLAVTVQLICTFLYAYAKSWLSHDMAQMNWCYAPSSSLIRVLMLAFSFESYGGTNCITPW